MTLHTRHYPTEAAGGNAVLLGALDDTPYAFAPFCWWMCELSAAQWRLLPQTSQSHYFAVLAAGFTAGTLTFTFSGGGLAAPVSVPVTAVTNAATTRDNAVAAIGAAAGLAAIRSSVNAIAGADFDVQYVNGTPVVDVDIAFVAAVQTFTATFNVAVGGDGFYDIIVSHPSIPGGSATSRVNRVAGAPATDTNMADAMEAELEADSRLSVLLNNADNAAGVNTLTFFSGVSGVGVTASAPVAGGLTIVNTTGTTAVDVFPDGITELDTAQPNDKLPTNVVRRCCYIETTETLAGLTSATLNVAGQTVLNAVNVSAVGVYGQTIAVHYVPMTTTGRPTLRWTPAANTKFPQTGKLFAVIEYCPKPRLPAV